MATPGVRKLTYEDYVRIPDDGLRHEILAGEEFVTPAPDVGHQRASRDLFVVLHAHVTRHGLGEVFYAPFDVLLSHEDIVQPDILFVAAEQAGIVGAKNAQGAPALVIEILSRSTAARDRGLKRERYERAGVSEYWIVDLAAHRVEVHAFGAAPRQSVHEADGVITSSLLPGLSVRVSDFA